MQIPSADQGTQTKPYFRPDRIKIISVGSRHSLVSLKVINQLIKRNRKDSGWDCISLEIPSNILVT